MLTINPNKCPQDHKCPLIPMCPKQAISQKGFNLPVIDDDKCIQCMVCVKNCPKSAVEEPE